MHLHVNLERPPSMNRLPIWMPSTSVHSNLSVCLSAISFRCPFNKCLPSCCSRVRGDGTDDSVVRPSTRPNGKQTMPVDSRNDQHWQRIVWTKLDDHLQSLLLALTYVRTPRNSCHRAKYGDRWMFPATPNNKNTAQQHHHHPAKINNNRVYNLVRSRTIRCRTIFVVAIFTTSP